MESQETEEARKLRIETQEKYAEIIRTLWRHENDLMSARFTWFTTIQGLLFTALGFSWQNHVRASVVVLGGLGACVAVSTLVVFSFNREAWQKLNDWWIQNIKLYAGPPITGNIPSSGSKKPKLLQAIEGVLKPWKVFPSAFFIAWVYIIYYVLHYGFSPR